jgi:hypothetical protein
MAQGVAYMVAAQQHRHSLEPERIINTVYGIVSDGIRWEFLRLDAAVFPGRNATDRWQLDMARLRPIAVEKLAAMGLTPAYSLKGAR